MKASEFYKAYCENPLKFHTGLPGTPPNCRQCGAPLEFEALAKSYDLHPYLSQEQDVEIPMSRVLKVGCFGRARGLNPSGLLVRWWSGRAGHNGDGVFCSERCGYEWAVGRIGSEEESDVEA